VTIFAVYDSVSSSRFRLKRDIAQIQYLLFPPVAIRLLLATDVEAHLIIWMVCPDLAEQLEASLTIGRQRRAVERGARPSEPQTPGLE
jgi:hypothetical protein